MIRNIITKLTRKYREYRLYKIYNAQWQRYMSEHGFENRTEEGEREYIDYWSQLSKYVSSAEYRFFSHYKTVKGEVISIPENIGHCVIEAALNPAEYTPLYLDKSMFPTFVGKDKCPRTLISRVNDSILLDENHLPLIKSVDEILHDYDGDILILKPSVDSCSGHGVMAFKRNLNKYECNGEILSEQFLYRYGDNFILQEGIQQSDYMSQFNTSSVNTIRLYVYKSVKDNSCHVVGGVLRIGQKGSFLDNAHAGGRFVGINMEDGRLGKVTYNTLGFPSAIHNGIDFTKHSFYIPNWESVKKFAEDVVGAIPHMHYVGLDIALDKFDKPILIEYNCGNGYNQSAASFWQLIYTQQHPFGKFSEEIVDYCKQKQNKRNE